MTHRNERGSSGSWMIVAITLIFVSVLTTGSAVWAIINYYNEKNTVDTQVETAAADAQKKQADEDETKFAAREKEPNRQFAGPDDYGRLTFDYPKTWSVFINKGGTSNGDTYEAYLNPVSVPPVSATTQYGLRVTIEQLDFDKVITKYDAQVKKGELKSSSVTINGEGGTRLEGNFTKDIRGSAVVFKIRDKTVTVRTDADTFKADFDKIISTIKYNQ